MDKKRIFSEYITNHYSNFEKVNFDNEKELIVFLENNKSALEHNLNNFLKTNVSKECNILDLGCGFGNFLFYLQSLKYRNVTGVDLSTEEIGICEKFFKSYKFYQADILNFVHDTQEKFDLVYLSHVLEHIKKDNLLDFLEGIKDILTDNGSIVIISPNSAAYFNSSANRYGDLTHETGFTDNSLRQVLMVSGFKNIEIRNFFGVGNFWLNFVRKITLPLFEIFIQLLGYDRQVIYTPSLLAIAKK